MFRSTNSLGQSLSSPFGSPPVLGTNSYSCFGQSAFGNTNQFGSQTTSSMFGTSTGVFRNPSTTPGFGSSTTSSFGNSNSKSNPFGSTNPFGSQTSSGSTFGTSTGVFGQPYGTTAFGSPTPSFGATSTPAFGSSTFGQQPTTGSFGSNSNQSSPFGSTNQFGSQISRGSTFGTSTGVFGQPYGTTAFGSPTPSFGATSTPAFGSSTFGQQPTTGSFGSNSNQSSPFGSSSAFNSSTAFGAPNRSAFGATSSPGFGQSNTPAFGTASSSPALFGSTTPAAFGSQSGPSAFGGASSTSSFSFGKPASTFGTTQPSAFGTQTTTQIGSQTTTPGFGQTGSANQQGSRVTSYAAVQEGTEKFISISVMPPYKDKKSHEELRWEDYQQGDKGGAQVQTQASSFNSTNTSSPFGQPTASTFGSLNNSQPTANTSAFGQPTASNAFGPTNTAATPFGQPASSNPFGQPTASTFGSPSNSQPAVNTSAFGQPAASNAFGPTNTVVTPFGQPASSNPFGQPTASTFGSPNNSQPAVSTSAFGQPAASNAFGPTNTTGTPFGQPASSNPFGQPTASTFGSPNNSQPAVNTSAFGQPAASNGFGPTNTAVTPFGQPASSNPFGQPTASTFGSPNNSQPAANTSAFGQPVASNAFGPTNTAVTPFGQPASSNPFGTANTSSPFGQPAATSSNPLGPQTTSFGSLSSPSSGSNSAPSSFSGTTTTLFCTTPSIFSSNASPGSTSTFATNSQSSSVFAQSTGGSLFSGTSSSLFSAANSAGFGQTTAPSLSTPFQQSAPAQTSNAFTLSNFGQLHSGNASLSTPNYSTVSSLRRGIAYMPVHEKPVPVKISPLLNPRHLSSGRIRLPARKYFPKPDGERVPFFDGEQTNKTTKLAGVTLIPRANPRSMINPSGRRPSETNTENQSASNGAPANGNGILAENRHANRPNGTHSPLSTIPVENDLANQPSIHEAELEPLIPKLRSADYYTEPQIQELAAKAREEPGYCSHVKDFVVGRRGFGSIKFCGETDVRGLDLESIVEFSNREVIVYKEGSKKPAAGKGLNKAAEVTLLNIKCVSRNSGKVYTAGPKIEKLTQMLVEKAEEQGAEFLAYDAAAGEWKFRVKHF